MEELHLKENTLFDLDFGVRVTQNVAQYPLHHVTYPDTKFKVAFRRRYIYKKCDKRTHARTYLQVGYSVILYLTKPY